MKKQLKKDPAQMKDRILLVASVLIAGALLADCGGGGSSAPASGTFSSVYSYIQSSNCVNCHYSGAPANNGNVNFTTQATAYSTLTNLYSTSSLNSGCGSVKIVAAGTPTSSMLMAMLFSGYQSPGTGCTPNYSSHSNIDSPFVPNATNLASFSTWISNGAPNN